MSDISTVSKELIGTLRMADFGGFTINWEEIIKHIEQLEAQLSEYKKDAERYRLINDFENDDEIGALLQQSAAIIAFKYQLPITFVAGRSISQIIDAALSHSNKAEQEKV